MKKILKERILFAVLISGIAIYFFGRIKPSSNGFLSKHCFAEKTFTKEKFDIIIFGDSRIYRGVSPDEMKKEIGSSEKILNFGYSGGGFSKQIFDAIEKKLDSRGEKIIILGITPHSLTDDAAGNNQFNEFLNKKREEVIEELYLYKFLNFFEPTSIADIKMSFDDSVNIYYETYFENGWVASNNKFPNPNEALPLYKKEFEQGKVNATIVNSLIVQIGIWHSAGITVYAFRPPTTEKMVKLENSMSSFDEKNISDRISAAGGIWLNIPLTGFISYDGSHLNEESAIKLSDTLATLIKKNFK